MGLLYRIIGDFFSYIGDIGDIGDTPTPALGGIYENVLAQFANSAHFQISLSSMMQLVSILPVLQFIY